jgi:hypothetical protein
MTESRRNSSVSLTWNQVNAWRLAQHSLLERADRKQLLVVVQQIGGVHAQLMPAAELALGARVDGLAPADVQNALWRKRTLVKTWAMRGTLHLLDAKELPLYRAALCTSVDSFYRRPSWLKYHGVTLGELDAITDGVRAAFSSSPITREQLADAIAKRMRKPKLRELLGSGWGALLKPAAHEGHLCFGPNQGQNVTFASPPKWLGGWQAADPTEALKEIARRYLAAYGPATTDDFGRWWGIDPNKAKRLFQSLGDEITPVEVEGWKACALVSTLQEMAKAKAAHSVRLLPYFDPLTVAVYRPCPYILPSKHKARVYRPQGWIAPVVLVDGRMEGVWDYDRQRSNVVVQVEMFEELTPKVKRGIEGEAQRLGEFLDAKVRMLYGEGQ